jgi:hypothetical protein
MKLQQSQAKLTRLGWSLVAVVAGAVTVVSCGGADKKQPMDMDSGGSGGAGGASTSGGAGNTGSPGGSAGSPGGSAGRSGTAGTTGTAGSTGSAGMSGTAGSPGSAGTMGTAGSGGASGAAGGAGGNVSRDGGTADAPRTDGGDARPSAGLTVTSTAFTEGGMIPQLHTCGGMNQSPPFAWPAGPAGTMSYALVMTDIMNLGFNHWMIWDIPAATTSLPTNVMKVANPAMPMGAKQNQSNGFGYAGPCPGAGTTHTYKFDVYALSVATLPNVTTASMRAQVMAEITKATLATGSISGRGMR